MVEGEKEKSKDSEPRKVLKMESVRKYLKRDGSIGHSVVKTQVKLKRMVIKSTYILTDCIVCPQAGDDAAAVRWQRVSGNIPLFASHVSILEKVTKMRNAAF